MVIVERREEGFRGGSDEKMRRMWLGLEIVVAGLPPLVELKVLYCRGKLYDSFDTNEIFLPCTIFK